MTDEAFDELVDAATDAVNLIPDQYLDRIGENARFAIVLSISDTLTEVLRGVIVVENAA